MSPGDVISYREMCDAEGINTLQRGMNYRLRGNCSVILLSRRPGAPYRDEVQSDGKILIYEGHDAPRIAGGVDPKTIDQPERTSSGQLTQNGKFALAASARGGTSEAERVRAYEKLHDGIWVYVGTFALDKALKVHDGKRIVFRFELRLLEDVQTSRSQPEHHESEHNRIIPTEVKLHVWKRDQGRCRECGSQKNLHFDHIIPYSKGGTSLKADNVQLLCAKHNLEKHDQIL